MLILDAALAESVATFRLALHVYVLMDNHYHLLVETSEANLGRAMQWLNVSYSVWFNRRHRRSGHLFQGRYKAIVVDPVGWGLELSRYVHLNPVRVRRLGLDKGARQRGRAGAGVKPQAQVVRERIATLRQYRWSSYRAYVGLAAAPAWLTCERVLALGGGRRGQPQRPAYREYVESAAREGLAESPWEQVTAQVVLGGAEFVRSLRRKVRGDPREQISVRHLRARPGLPEVIAAVEAVQGERWEQFRDRYGDSGRDLVLYLGRKAGGMKLRELAEAAGGIDYVSAGAAVKRFERRLFKVPGLSELLRRAQTALEKSQM
jgi:hypothetical protein